MEQVALFLKEKLKVTAVQIVGDPTTKVERLGVLVGGGSLGLGMAHLPAWLETILPGVPIQFSEAGEPFTYL